MKQNSINNRTIPQKQFNSKTNIQTNKKIQSNNIYLKTSNNHNNLKNGFKNIGPNPRVKKFASNNRENLRNIPMQRSVIPERINIPQKTTFSQNVIKQIGVERANNINENISLDNSKYYSLKEILKLGIDTSTTKKVFINGETRYVVESNNINEIIDNNVNNLNTNNNEIMNENESLIDQMFVNEEASDINDAHYDYQEENTDEINDEIAEQYESNIESNMQFINKQKQELDNSENINQSNEVNVYDDELYHSEEEISDSNEVYDIQDLNYQNNEDEYIDDVDYVQEYYDDTFQDTFEQIEYDKKIDYEEKIKPLQIVKNWNKKLWRPEDVLYKIYNISFNQNHDDPYAGCLYNFSFDIYPGDRIAILSHDSMSDLLLLDILKNYVPKDSGYVFFNLKREQKWFDIYSSEFDGFDIEMYNRRYEAIYQLQSPDYFEYGKNKNDTVDSTFKKIFNKIKQVVNEKLFNDLLYLLDFEKELDTLMSSLDDLKSRKFVFICDVLIGKKIIIMSNLTEGFDITQKISFYRYINALYQDSDTVIIFNVKDSFEVKLLANRLIIIDDGEPVVNKRIKDILNTFETLDTFIIEAFDKLHKKYLE